MGNSASDLIVQTIKRQFLDVIIYLLTAAKAYINITFLLAVTADCAFIYNYTFVALTRVIAHAMNDPQNFFFLYLVNLVGTMHAYHGPVHVP